LAVAAAVFALVAILGSPATAQPDDGPFAKAIAYAQARTVKIYGAGIGREPGYASGIIISADGRILTAAGIYLSGERIQVVLPDGSLHRAKIVRRSQPLQTVLLQIDAKTPDHFELAAASVVRKGDWVLAVSNPFKVADGREPLSVNLGIVSLRTRLEAKRGTQDVPYEGDVLLIDAITSNPGAPGGALVTTSGELGAMIGRIIESKDTGTRLNYAVPADLLAKFVAGKLIDPKIVSPAPSGKVETGIRLFTLGGKRAVAYVDRVVPNSPAAKAGLRPDDLILRIAGQTVHDIRAYETILKTLAPGKEVIFEIKRKQQLLSVPITPEGEKE